MTSNRLDRFWFDLDVVEPQRGVQRRNVTLTNLAQVHVHPYELFSLGLKEPNVFLRFADGSIQSGQTAFELGVLFDTFAIKASALCD